MALESIISISLILITILFQDYFNYQQQRGVLPFKDVFKKLSYVSNSILVLMLIWLFGFAWGIVLCVVVYLELLSKIFLWPFSMIYKSAYVDRITVNILNVKESGSGPIFYIAYFFYILILFSVLILNYRSDNSEQAKYDLFWYFDNDYLKLFVGIGICAVTSVAIKKIVQRVFGSTSEND